MVFRYSQKYRHLLGNVNSIETLPSSVRSNVLKSLACLTKFLGCYIEFKSELKRYGIKWNVNNDGLSTFLKLFNNNANTMEWYKLAFNKLKNNEKLYLKYVALSGLRPMEAIISFNKIIESAKKNKLNDYYNENLSTLEHFKFREFLRGTKNAYITIMPRDFVLDVAGNTPISYFTIKKHLRRGKLAIRIKELRSFYASFMVRHGLIREEVDLLQGRVPKSIFVRHYLTINFRELANRTLEALRQLEQQLN